MEHSLTTILTKSGIAFGTSGARGLVEDFTPTVCAAFTQSFLSAIQPAGPRRAVALAIDNRPSSQAMAESCAGMATALGFSVHYYGVIPTPALALQAQTLGIPAIMITGSHIPFDRNGIKFYKAEGEISKADELAIMSAAGLLQPSEPMRLDVIDPDAAKAYLARYLSICPSDLLQDKHIGIYEHSSAGRDLYYQLFTALGAKVTRLERTDHFVPIDTEAVSLADQQKAANWVAELKLDAIFSTDGDGDRPLIADEQGRWFRGDTLGLLTAKALKINRLAVPVNANSAIDLCGDFTQVLRTRIGSPYVIAGMQALQQNTGSVAGFEANGGFLLATPLMVGQLPLAALPTRDAVLPFIALHLLAAGQPLSSLLNDLPQRFTASDRVTEFAQAESAALLAKASKEPAEILHGLGLVNAEVSQLDLTDGVRMHLTDSTIIHLRASGNAPELRVYTEATSQESANQLAAQLCAALQNQH